MKTVLQSLAVCAIAVATFVTTPLRAQTQQQPPSSHPPPAVAILAGRLIDVRTEHVNINAYIVVEKERIARIETAAPQGMKIIDLSKYTVVPGLIDCHAHLLGNPKDQSAMSGLRCPPRKAPSGACTTLPSDSITVSPRCAMPASPTSAMANSHCATASIGDSSTDHASSPRAISSPSTVVTAMPIRSRRINSYPDRPTLPITSTKSVSPCGATSSLAPTGSSSWPPAESWTPSATTPCRS